jgi:predicted RNA-binding protein YlxR (DUF448 family)
VILEAATPALDHAPADRAPERRCIVTGDVRPKEGLIRLVVRPGAAPGAAGEVVPDLAERLPGRGLWITARRDIVTQAVTKTLFAKAARAPVHVAPDLANRIADQLARRCRDYLGMARRAGQAVIGFEQAREWLARGRAAVLVHASDGAADGRRKLGDPASGVARVMVLSGQELGSAFGRDYVGHVALAPGRIATNFRREADRLAGFRDAASGNERLSTDG